MKSALFLICSYSLLFAGGCCSVSRTGCIEGRVLSEPEQWRSYFDFYLDTECGRKKVSIRGNRSAPYAALIGKGRFVSITGIDKRLLDKYVIDVDEKDIRIKVDLLR